jgi:hypothetical protein
MCGVWMSRSVALRRTHLVDVAERDPDQRVAALAIRQRVIRRALHLGDAEVGGRHPQRIQDLPLHCLTPGAVRQTTQEVAGHHVHHVVVLPRLPEPAVRLEMAQPLEQLLGRAIDGVVPRQVMAGEAGAMRDHVAPRELQRRDVVPQLESRQVFADRLIPVEAAGVRLLRQRERGERLRR